MTPRRGPLWRLGALILVLALIAAACSGDEATDPTAPVDEPPGVTVPDGDDPEATPEDPDPAQPAPSDGQFVYNLGVFEDMQTTNTWADSDACCNSVWNRYVLDTTYDSLYDLMYPGLDFRASLAAVDEVPLPEEEGDVWVARIPMKENAVWSDGEPITAHDVAFTWNTVWEFCLGGAWIDAITPAAPHPNCVAEDAQPSESLGVLSVEAEDDHTVAVTFNGQPGLAIWGAGNGVWNMNVFPQHFWESTVEEARGTEDPRTTLIQAPGEEAPAAGMTVFGQHVPGSHAQTTTNEVYHDTDGEVTSGDVTYAVGPFATEMNFTLYGSQDAAVLGLAAGEVDFLLNPLGMAVGLQEQVLDNPALTAISNPINGYRYLGFNLEREPMSDQAFRDAMAVIIDKEFITESLLQGVPYPVYSMIPQGNEFWHRPEVEAEIREEQMGGASHEERVAEAVRILSDAGYTWESTPHYDDDGVFQAGVGIIGPDGDPVRSLELISPTPAYDPFRATFGQQISASALEMGIPVANLPTDFNRIIDIVYTPVDGELEYDMFVLGWQLGNAAFPTFWSAFFGSQNLTVVNDGNNNTGYVSAEFDEVAARYNSTLDIDEALELTAEMERILARDKPYILLFEAGILEFYNSENLTYPFTESLAGIQAIDGAQGYVRTR